MDFCKQTTGKFVQRYDKWLDSGGGCEKVAEYQQNEINNLNIYMHTRWHGWLRHWATSRKFAVSILDEVIRIFH